MELEDVKKLYNSYKVRTVKTYKTKLKVLRIKLPNNYNAILNVLSFNEKLLNVDANHFITKYLKWLLTWVKRHTRNHLNSKQKTALSYWFVEIDNKFVLSCVVLNFGVASANEIWKNKELEVYQEI